MSRYKKLNIIHIILSKGFAGSEKYVCDLVKFQKKKHKVLVITSKKNFLLNNTIKKNVEHVEIGYFFKKFKINSIISSFRPDIVHTHLGEAAKLVNSSRKYKIVSTLHMNYKHSYYKNSNALIVSNQTQLRDTKKIYNGKIFKSYLWIDLPKITISKNKLKKKLGIPKKNFVFGSIGRFHPQKGFDIILKVFNKIDIKNYNLLLVGNGHYNFKEIEKKNPNIKIIGHVENVSNYYNLLDVGLFISRWETFGYTLIEAMKFKLPIIGSKHMGNKDWIDKFNITQVKVNSINQIKKSVKKIYKNKPKKKNYNLSMFNYKKNCNSITGIYRKILVS